jgi:hypothetical protein
MKICDKEVTIPLILLYVSVMFVITFLQQEFVLLPEIQNLDIIGDEARISLLERYQHMRWLSFLLLPILLLFRLFLVTSCLFVGGFFFIEMSGWRFGEWWGVATIAQSVMLFYSVILCIISMSVEANTVMVFNESISLMFLVGKNVEPWVRLPLSAVNAFEILYWVLMSLLVGRLCGTKYGKSFLFVMSTYGVGYLFYVAFLMFLMMYLA